MNNWFVKLLAIMLAFELTGCASQTDPEAADSARPVSTEESQLLAIARFNNFDAGSRGFTAGIQEQGIDLQLQGWFDYIEHVGYAATTGTFESQALIWTPSLVGILEKQPDGAGNPILPMPALDDPALATATLDPSSSRLDSLLAVIGSLGADRPDNPLLLQQSGALWLRDDQIGESPVTVFAAPPSDSPRDSSSPPLDADTSPLRLWVDSDGLLLRTETRIGDAWVTIDFSKDPGPELSLPDGDQQ